MNPKRVLAVIGTAVLLGSAGLSAQPRATQPPAPSDPTAPTLLRAFTNLFAPASTPRLSAPLLSPFLGRGQRELKALPSGTKCHIIVAPADPAIDPRMSIAPQASTRFTMREGRTERICR